MSAAVAPEMLMSFVTSVKMYENCDVYIMQNNIEQFGFDKNKTFGEMLDLAVLNKCNIITKNGRGKWYLKGQNKDFNDSLMKAEENAGKFQRIKCWLIQVEQNE